MKKVFSIEEHLAKHEYVEGRQALANFNQVATAVLQSKKTVVPGKVVPKKKAAKRKSGKAGD